MITLCPNMLTLNYQIDDNSSELRVLPIKKVYAYQRTRFCQFLIAENREKGKFLAIDGRIQRTEFDYSDYHTALLNYVPRVPKKMDSIVPKALVLGFGVGVTGALLSEMGYEVDSVDADGVLIKAIQEHLGEWTKPIPAPNKVTTYIYDAFDFLEHVHAEENRYDIIIFDLPEPSATNEDCYSQDLIKKIREVLKPSGSFVYQNGSLYDKDPIMDKLVEDQIKERKESLCKSAEWRFRTVTFKED